MIALVMKVTNTVLRAHRADLGFVLRALLAVGVVVTFILLLHFA
jgi:hypothetical protein